MRQFYTTFPKSHALRDQLSWTHYRLLMKIDNIPRHEFYMIACLPLRRRTEKVRKKKSILPEPKTDPDYILKNPYIQEFLDLKENKKYHENELEKALINKLQEFLLELGKGFTFVARQRRITTEGDHYYSALN